MQSVVLADANHQTCIAIIEYRTRLWYRTVSKELRYRMNYGIDPALAETQWGAPALARGARGGRDTATFDLQLMASGESSNVVGIDFRILTRNNAPLRLLLLHKRRCATIRGDWTSRRSGFDESIRGIKRGAADLIKAVATRAAGRERWTCMIRATVISVE